jgi:hypothetical protein
VKETPAGNTPVSVRAGEPVEVMVNVPGAPTVKVTLFPLVICGAAEVWAKAAKPVVVNSTRSKVGMRRIVWEGIWHKPGSIDKRESLAISVTPLFPNGFASIKANSKITSVFPWNSLKGVGIGGAVVT